MGSFTDHMSTHGMSSDLFRPELKVSNDGKNTVTHINGNELSMIPREFSQFLEMKARERKITNRGSMSIMIIDHLLYSFIHSLIESGCGDCPCY